MSWEPWSGAVPDDLSLETEVTHLGAALDFCLTSFAVPIATSELADAMTAIAGPDLQRIPLDIPDYDDFEVLNSTRMIRCLDEDRSKYTKWTEKDHRADLAGQYRMVIGIKIKPENIPSNAHFFRIEGWPIALIVSEAMKTAMESCGCRGAKFEDVT